jgi:hypothetical protein
MVERTVSAIAMAAAMLFAWAPLPVERSVPSRKTKICVPDGSIVYSSSEGFHPLECKSNYASTRI